ncbi:MAG: hypothetical protein HY290_21325 [Planctomycetia bacterium]|nr:hypothetical protein [Planctomycetia bacterium]
MINRWITTTAAVASVLCALSAQVQAAALPVLAQVKVSETGGKTFILEGLVTVVLMGGALFVVCKTSRRN